MLWRKTRASMDHWWSICRLGQKKERKYLYLLKRTLDLLLYVCLTFLCEFLALCVCYFHGRINNTYIKSTCTHSTFPMPFYRLGKLDDFCSGYIDCRLASGEQIVYPSSPEIRECQRHLHCIQNTLVCLTSPPHKSHQLHFQYIYHPQTTRRTLEYSPTSPLWFGICFHLAGVPSKEEVCGAVVDFFCII